ncbi:unnamed protein product, partial [Brassica rapa]
QPTWDKITRTVHRKGHRAESKDQPTDVLCVLTDTDGQPQTATDVLTNVLICVLMDSHGRPVCADGHTWIHTDYHRPMDVLCVLADTHGRPVCSDGQPQTAMDVLCVLADTHGRPVCTEHTAHVGRNQPNCPQEGPAC